MVVVVDGYSTPEVTFETSKIAGFDFGLKAFLTCSDSVAVATLGASGFKIESPLFLKSSLATLQKASKQHSRKQKGSNNREQARKHLVRCHETIGNRRRDWQWALAHKLTDQFDVLCFETLNLKGMQRLWGRKVNDLALGDFLQILEWVAKKKGKRVVYIDPWYPSSKTCWECGHVLDELDLSVRRWRCPACHQVNDRDDNAALNIKRVGSSTLGVGDVRQELLLQSLLDA
jgi:putative transposase